MKSAILLSLVLPFAALVTGCASITSGKTQNLTVQSTCKGAPADGARCTLANSNGSWIVTTPGSVGIQKAYADMTVTCRKEDLTGMGVFKSSSNGGVWGNILAGGIIGYAVDANTGAGFDYPQQLVVEICDGQPVKKASN